MAVDIRTLAPVTREITIGEAVVEIRGLSLRSFAALTLRFPQVLGLLGGSKVDPAVLLTQLPDAAIAIMAAGLGKADDPEIEAALDSWAFSQQAELLSAVLDLTFGGDKALPFVQMLLSAAALAARADEAKPENPSTSAPNSPGSETS